MTKKLLTFKQQGSNTIDAGLFFLKLKLNIKEKTAKERIRVFIFIKLIRKKLLKGRQ